MSYITEKHPQGLAKSEVNKIREAMIAELVATNTYAEHIAKCSNEEIISVWTHIMEEEKEHYGKFLALLREFDAEQMELYQDVKSSFDLDQEKEILPDGQEYTEHVALNFIREDIKGELEAIILYEQHIDEIPDDRIKVTFKEIINEEKEHVEELTKLLLKYDQNNYGPLSEDNMS